MAIILQNLKIHLCCIQEILIHSKLQFAVQEVFIHSEFNFVHSWECVCNDQLTILLHALYNFCCSTSLTYIPRSSILLSVVSVTFVRVVVLKYSKDGSILIVWQFEYYLDSICWWASWLIGKGRRQSHTRRVRVSCWLIIMQAF